MKSGFCFRVQNDSGRWISDNFEDLTEAQRQELLNDRDTEFLKKMVLGMSRVLRATQDQLIVKEHEIYELKILLENNNG